MDLVPQPMKIELSLMQKLLMQKKLVLMPRLLSIHYLVKLVLFLQTKLLLA